MGWLSGWDKRIKLTIDQTKVDTANQSNFPVLVYLSISSGITSADISCVFDELISDSNRKKIAVTASDGTTECYVEIERWDDASEKAWLWVKVPSVAYNADTDLYLYYDSDHADNTAYVGDTTDAVTHNVWDNNFVGVWHMGQDPSGGADCIKDSTSYGRDGTPYGTMLIADLVDGEIGKAIDFDGADDSIRCSGITLGQATGVTLEAIAKVPSALASSKYLVVNQQSGDATTANILYLSYSAPDLYLSCYIATSATARIGAYTTNIDRDAFISLAGVYKGDQLAPDVYKNGIEVTNSDTNGTGTDITNDTGLICISGRSYDNNRNFEGVEDEVRISNIDRSAPWLKATHYSNFDNLVTFGSEEILLTNVFDGKIRIKDTKDDLFDGKIEISVGTKTDLFDGKIRIKDTKDDLFDGKIRIKDTKDDLFDGKIRIKDTGTGIFDGKIWIALLSSQHILGGTGEPGKLDILSPLGVSVLRKILLGLGETLDYLLQIPMAQTEAQQVINHLSDYINAIQMLINSLSVGDPISSQQSVFMALQSDSGAINLCGELSGIVAGIQSLITALTDSVSSQQAVIVELALQNDIQSLLVLLGSMPDPVVTHIKPSLGVPLEGAPPSEYAMCVYLDGMPINNQITDLSFVMDREVTFDVLSFSSIDVQLYAKLQEVVGNKDSVLEIQYKGTSWLFLIEEVSGYELSYNVWGRSIAAAKSDAPFEDSINFVLETDTLASVLAEDLIPDLSVDWNVVDWTILAGWTANGTPVQMLKKLADSVGAVVRSYPDGTGFYIDEKYTTRPINLLYAASVDDFDRDTDLISLDASRELGTGANAVTVHGYSPLSKYSVKLEADSCVDVGNPAVIKVYPALDGVGYSLIASDGAPTYQHSLTEEHVEIVSFVGGKGSVSYPITSLTSITWDGAAPSGYEYTAGQNEIVLTDGTLAAIGEVIYSTRYDVWHGTHFGEGQLLVVCYLDEGGGIVARVYFGDGDREVDDIDRPALTSIVAATAAGQAFLDDTSYNRLLRSIVVPCSDVSDGDVVSVHSDLSGVTGNTFVLRHEISAMVDNEALKISSNLNVVQFEVES